MAVTMAENITSAPSCRGSRTARRACARPKAARSRRSRSEAEQHGDDQAELACSATSDWKGASFHSLRTNQATA